MKQISGGFFDSLTDGLASLNPYQPSSGTNIRQGPGQCPGSVGPDINTWVHWSEGDTLDVPIDYSWECQQGGTTGFRDAQGYHWNFPAGQTAFLANDGTLEWKEGGQTWIDGELSEQGKAPPPSVDPQGVALPPRQMTERMTLAKMQNDGRVDTMNTNTEQAKKLTTAGTTKKKKKSKKRGLVLLAGAGAVFYALAK